ncbi:MAG: hypothetical protein L0229_31400 [Blastocatellia bacterium]|nr:hypothetical protein [Blastocatellia bacterium]
MAESSKSPAEEKRKVTVTEALAQLPGEKGERFATVFKHGSLLVEIYAPRGIDPQKPHTRDEIYTARGIK